MASILRVCDTTTTTTSCQLSIGGLWAAGRAPGEQQQQSSAGLSFALSRAHTHTLLLHHRTHRDDERVAEGIATMEKKIHTHTHWDREMKVLLRALSLSLSHTVTGTRAHTQSTKQIARAGGERQKKNEKRKEEMAGSVCGRKSCFHC